MHDDKKQEEIMRAIIVDDEPIMIRSFLRATKNIENFEIVGQFEDSEEALMYVENNPIDVAFMDIEMPIMNGIELANEIKNIRSDIVLVFVTAYDNYIREANDLGTFYYIVKPYKREIMVQTIDRISRLMPKQPEKKIYLQTFGRFTIFKDGKPVSLVGKAKEILALITTRRGKEISNESIYTIIWEERECDNIHMKVYYNAIKRLKDNLLKAGIEDILISTSRGQLINTDLVDCDYYAWQDGKTDERHRFEGEFLSEYSWAEGLLAEMLERG